MTHYPPLQHGSAYPQPNMKDHTPVIIEEPSRSYSSATHQDMFRQRRQRRSDDESDDIDLSIDYDSKQAKIKNKRMLAHKEAQKRDWKIVAALTVWAAYVRLWKIWQPSSVVFDEVHFGGFAAKYIRTRFFMDVHPPLAKMLIALVAKLSGFDGVFDFKDIGKDYIESDVPYVPIRVFCGICGLLVVPIAYLTMRGSGHSVAAGLVVALMVCYENGLIANNRLILLDPPLLFFTAATTLMWINFHNQKNKPFQFWWYTWLALTGLGLGLTVSCKWVGLFTIATIGVSTIKNLWDLWGDSRIPVNVFVRHFLARAACLIALPVVVYMLMFGIHFHSLPNSGEGDGFMSPEFQQTLAGHSMADTPIDIAYGSNVYLRHVATRGGYLHSHPHDYLTGSKQQQVTLYPHRDNNNWWTIHKSTTNETVGIEYVKDNDIIRLIHRDTGKRLHSHEHRPPMTDLDYHNEVSAYGFPGFNGDANDFWRVEIIDHDKRDPESEDRLRTIHSRFRLIHVMSGCSLFSHSVKLPEWGFGQQEVTCIKSGKIPKTVWYIESTENSQLPDDTEKVNYNRPGFIGKFLELNKVMWDTNKGLTASHPYDSRPSSWPVLKRGINFWGKGDLGLHIYLLGNPLVFWGSTVAIFSYIAIKAVFLLLEKRGFQTDFGGLRKFYDESAGFFLMGWCFHYFPFFLMGRQLFLHHYMPALYFAILLFGVGFDLLTIRLVNRKRLIAAAAFVMCVIYVYRSFIPITYGEPWTKKDCEKAKWLPTWDFDCIQFRDDISAYYPDGKQPKLELMQEAIKSYFAPAESKEQAAAAIDAVNIISDGIVLAAQSDPVLKENPQQQVTDVDAQG